MLIARAVTKRTSLSIAAFAVVKDSYMKAEIAASLEERPWSIIETKLTTCVWKVPAEFRVKRKSV